jgi:hypothetical protein
MPRAEIPEGAWRHFNAMRWGWGTNEEEMATEREALEAIVPALHAHWLEQLKEELLGDAALDRHGRTVEMNTGIDHLQRSVSRVAVNAALKEATEQ